MFAMKDNIQMIKNYYMYFTDIKFTYEILKSVVNKRLDVKLLHTMGGLKLEVDVVKYDDARIIYDSYVFDSNESIGTLQNEHIKYMSNWDISLTHVPYLDDDLSKFFYDKDA